MQERGVFYNWPSHLPDVVALGRFHLDDISTKISKVKSYGARAEQGKLDNSKAC
jgi:hypothetical protein